MKTGSIHHFTDILLDYMRNYLFFLPNKQTKAFFAEENTKVIWICKIVLCSADVDTHRILHLFCIDLKQSSIWWTLIPVFHLTARLQEPMVQTSCHWVSLKWHCQYLQNLNSQSIKLDQLVF